MKAVTNVDIIDGKCVVTYSDGSTQELYEYPSDGGSTGGVSSVNGMTGDVVIPTATTSVNGLMSRTDKSNLETVRTQVNNINSELNQIAETNNDIITQSTWSRTRVKAEDGTLTASPSQLTSDIIMHVGKYNILKITADTDARNISVSYYTKNNDGSFSYVQSDASRVRYLKYVCLKYDYIRLSFVGTSANQPQLTEFTTLVQKTSNHDFFGKNISFLGDSITTFSGVSETNAEYNAPYYPTNNVTAYEQTYGKMFYDACGATAISVSAITASSWRNQGNAQSPSAYETTRITRLSANGTPDYVFINMGTNDPYSTNIGTEIGYTYDVATLEANVVYSSYAIQTTIRKIQTTYPSAKIILLIPKFPSAIGSGNYTFEKWEKLCDFMVQIAEMYGVYKIVDLRKCGITVDTFTTDCISAGMHPNFSGMKKMGSYLIDELLVK